MITLIYILMLQIYLYYWYIKYKTYFTMKEAITWSPSTNEETLKHVDKYITWGCWENTKQNPKNLWEKIVCIFHEMYPMPSGLFY